MGAAEVVAQPGRPERGLGCLMIPPQAQQRFRLTRVGDRFIWIETEGSFKGPDGIIPPTHLQPRLPDERISRRRSVPRHLGPPQMLHSTRHKSARPGGDIRPLKRPIPRGGQRNREIVVAPTLPTPPTTREHRARAIAMR